MGLFGIKTRKEKLAEAQAARKEQQLIEEIQDWDFKQCKEALKKGGYSYEVHLAIEKRATKLERAGRERNIDNKIASLTSQIRAKEARISQLENAPLKWENVGYGMKTANITEQYDNNKSEIRRLQREISDLKRQINRLEDQR